MADHFDLIVIGSGPGGASLAHRLAPSGKRILILERGEYLPRTERNWSSQAVFVEGQYQADENWTNSAGDHFKPALHYFVGGNSKVYGAALFRLRERDFGELIHAGGVSPAWPLGYDTFEPYYAQAETLFHVHGQRSEDPLEPSVDHDRHRRHGTCSVPCTPTRLQSSLCGSASMSDEHQARSRLLGDAEHGRWLIAPAEPVI